MGGLFFMIDRRDWQTQKCALENGNFFVDRAESRHLYCAPFPSRAVRGLKPQHVEVGLCS